MPDHDQDCAQRVWAVLPPLMRAISAHLRLQEPRWELTMWQIIALKWLRTGALSVGELARKFLVSTPTMTRLLDNLVERGLVERREDPRDRRLVRLFLTEKGKDIFEDLERRALRCVEEIIVDLEAEEKDRVVVAMDILQRALQRPFQAQQRGPSHG